MDTRTQSIIEKAKLLSSQMPHTEMAFCDGQQPLTDIEQKALGGAGNCIDDLMDVIITLHDILEKHRKFHSKVACPGRPDCDSCVAEELLASYGSTWYACHITLLQEAEKAKYKKLLESARQKSLQYPSWIQLHNKLFNPNDGILAKAFESQEQREAFVQSDEYKEIKALFREAEKKHDRY
jgi:hypothetical protein